jgi:uncharacterized membrane protein YqjE
MAASATGTKMVSSSANVVQESGENLTSLLSRLGDDVMLLVDTKLSLLKVELKDEANSFARAAALLSIGGVIAAIGFALLNVAVAFGISTLFASLELSQAARYALGFVATGALYLLIGGIVVLAMKNRLTKQSIVPDRTVAELRKDKEWLKNEL